MTQEGIRAKEHQTKLMAQSWHLMYPAHHPWFVEKHCQNPELVDDVGIPILTHKDDLVAPAPLWLKKTEEIRNDPVICNQVGWIAEMWAYALAAAELGLRHTTCELACVNKEDLADRPVVHYCYASSDATNDRWVWDKRIYRPWERVPDPPDGVPLATKALVSLCSMSG